MDEGSKTRHKTTALDSVKTQILCNAELRQDFAKCVVLFKDYIYIMQTKVNKPQELNISSTVTKTETEQKKRKPQGRVEDRYYTIQEYKALSYEQKKELKDLQAYRGHNPKRRRFNKGSVKEQLAALEQQVSVLQSNHGTNARTGQKTTQSGTPAPANASTNSENSNNCNHSALTHQ